MKDLVIINGKKEAVCSHIHISVGMLVTQDATLQLIKKYKLDLQEFGKVRFQNVPLESGQKQKQFMLNRNQTIFLITLMRNNPKTVNFKKSLVKQFSNMESWIKDRLQSSLEFKVMSATLDQVRQLDGKDTKHYHYANEAKLVNWVISGKYGSLDRESLSEKDLQILNKLQTRNTALIGAGMPRDTRKESLSLYYLLNS